jgi:type I restriction enzyme, R subunit
VAIIVEDFQASVSDKLSGKATAMIVTASRLHSARYRLAVDAYLKKLGSPQRALLVFPAMVKDAKDGKGSTGAR